MNNKAIVVSNLTKEFTFSVKKEGRGFFKNLFNPEKKTVKAVNDISFSVAKGERIAFIGPNGAGKSTTIKMLTGILFPSSGNVEILGINPSQERKKLAYRIGTVFGQRSQLLPNLPLTDSLEFFGKMYDLSNEEIIERSEYLIEEFDLKNFIHQPVRKLSLGQRMRAEVAVSLIHNPDIIFLDEPTIGLDIVAKKALRDLLISINEKQGITIFLTSHDVGDIEQLCERTVIINDGQVVIDAPTIELRKKYVHQKYVDLVLEKAVNSYPELPLGIMYKDQEREKITVSVDTSMLSVSDALQKMLPFFEVADIDVYNIDLETVIREMYEKTSVH